MNIADDGDVHEDSRGAGTSAPLRTLLTIADVARLLQLNIRTVRRMVDRGDLTWVRIEQTAFKAFIETHRSCRVK